MSHTIHLPGNWIASCDMQPSDGSIIILKKGALGVAHKIPYAVLFAFIAEMVRKEKIDRLERADPDGVFYL